MLFKKLKRNRNTNIENDVHSLEIKPVTDKKDLYYNSIAQALQLIDLEEKMKSALESARVY
ncbi:MULTISPECIES: hypothetical protein [unclassified Oceanispirochaeta]|uniref:hypothetical protein n=1 Tax=unclassified Oceanispirochaeta TaxID=2635722 RepID=UPI000E095FAA|nr:MULTISPECIES: hypothetical protein [unclassified Oceanispirochaeta]MBF9017468.1 hypothetical protein [Oceanispirochaeta sp. M2]NPD74040.1 hypothetical protein [Oceanispirochaeta sp. M1]RDG30208.1 hypothetical protein DV872_18245 [Oceanispirochaeta sp. M1]